jgi:hypothetical protein
MIKATGANLNAMRSLEEGTEAQIVEIRKTSSVEPRLFG